EHCRGPRWSVLINPEIRILKRGLRLVAVALARDGGARSFRPMSTETTTRRYGMIIVSVMYPNTPGNRFDHEYYRDKHMPLVKARLGAACKFYTVDKGLAARPP